MRKIIAMITVLFLCTVLCCCTGKAPLNPDIPEDTTEVSSVPENATTSTPPQIDENIDYVPIREPLVSVCLPVQTNNYYADDGTLLLTYRTQAMELTIQEPEIANRVIVDFLNRVDPVSRNAESLASTAEEYYSPDAPWTPYLCQQLYSPTRLDPGVLSLFGTNITYNGFSHADQSCVSANYSLITGDVLTLGSIIAHADQLDDLRDLVIEQLESIKEEKQLYSDFVKTVTAQFAADESTNEKWFFTQTGLCFYFSPYEIAPYNSGIIFAEVPYESLLGILDDAFFPTERLTTDGDLSCSDFSENSTEGVAHFTEAVLEENAKMLVIRADQPAQNIRFQIELEGQNITVFYAYGLYYDEAIVLEATEELLTNITILYDRDGETVAVPAIP